MKADKMRQNATLQEKLAKRREKKKRALAQGAHTATASPAVGIGADNEDGIIGERSNRENAQELDKINVSGYHLFISAVPITNWAYIVCMNTKAKKHFLLSIFRGDQSSHLWYSNRSRSNVVNLDFSASRCRNF